MLTTSPIGQPARNGQAYARGSAIAGVVALAPMVWLMLLQFPETLVWLIAERLLKIAQTTGLLPVIIMVALVASLSALLLGILANPRAHWQAIVGIIAGSAALLLLVFVVMLSTRPGHVWLLGSSLSLIR